MANRSPGGYLSVDASAIEPADFLEYSPLDQIYDNQQWVLESRQVIIADCLGFRIGRANAAYSTPGPPYSPGIFTWKFQGGDIAGVGGTTSASAITCEVSALTWCSDGTTAGKCRFATDGANDTVELTLAAGTTTPTWMAVGEVDILTNGGVETLSFDMKRTAGAGTMYVGGFWMITKWP